MIVKENASEIAQLRERIEKEHQASVWALTGLAEGAAQHRFINRRYRAIDACYERLRQIIGEPQAIQVVGSIFDRVPSSTEHP